MGWGGHGLDHDEGMQKVQGYRVGAEGGVGLPERDRHDVVVDVSLPLELLEVGLIEREEPGTRPEPIVGSENTVF